MKLIPVIILLLLLPLAGCSFHTAKGTGIGFLVEDSHTIKENGVEITTATKPDLRSIKVIGSTSAGIITGNMWAPAVVAGADSIGDGIGKAVNKTGDAVGNVFTPQSVRFIEPIPIPTPTPKPKTNQ
jgi:hypothetical protein